MGLDLSTTIIPLSKLDSVIEGCGITTFWVVDCPGDSFSVPILEAALSRTIDKWRVFAGRLRRETGVSPELDQF